MKVLVLAGALLVLAAGAGWPQDIKTPKVVAAAIDWQAAVADIGTPEEDAEQAPVLSRLNAVSGRLFPDIEMSGVPVLLPLDVAAVLRNPDRAAGLLEFKSAFFYPGPSGYDAMLMIRAADVPELPDSAFSDPIPVMISSSALLYELGPSVATADAAVPALEAAFPGIRRFMHESYLRYTFVRFGVPYAISIACSDYAFRGRRVSCKIADRVAEHVIRSLRVAGGAPRETQDPAEPAPVERPREISPSFTYHSAGELLPGTGFKGHDGHVDETAYARIRFPIAEAPAYANSQSFMNWGDCNLTGRLPGAQGQAYRCRLNGKPLVFDESAPENYSYPWRDNFCEHRHFLVGQCPGGQGHQGQDIRPSSCTLRNEGADRCEAYEHDVVAVRDGAILRAPRQEAVYLVVNTPTERFRVRYMHMHPRKSDDANLLSGRMVREGEIIGKVGNFNRREGGTTYHLHFDVQVPTRDGWVFVNPYLTLVAAYERLIGARGTEIKDTPAETAALAAPTQASADEPEMEIKKPKKAKKAAKKKFSKKRKRRR